MRKLFYEIGIVFTTIFLGELTVMLIMGISDRFQYSPIMEAMIDASVLSLITTPLIYYWAIRQPGTLLTQVPKNGQKSTQKLYHQNRYTFFYYLLTLTIFLGLLLGMVYSTINRNEIETLYERQSEKLDHLVKNTKYILSQTFYDLDFLADLPTVKKALEQDANSQSASNLATMTLKQFSISHPDYFQIRLLDKNGFEKVRINSDGGKVSITDKNELQDKSHRYYFKNTIKLKPGQYYRSSFDLNVEHDAIQIPFKPTVRFSRPVFSDDMHLLGIVILNYDVRNLFQQMLDDWTNELGDLSILNDNGYWLVANNPDDEWQFMFPGHEDNNFKKRYPDLWEKFAQNQFKDSNGSIYTTKRLDIIEGEKKPLWLLSSIPAEIIAQLNKTLRSQLVILYISLWVPAAIFLWIAMNIHRRKEITMALLVEQQQQNTLILNSIQETFIAVDNNWNITRTNLTAEMFSDSQRDLTGMNLWEVIPELSSFFYKQSHEAMNKKQPVVIRGYYPPRDIWLECRIYPLDDGLSMYFMDVTKERKILDQLKRNQNQMQDILDKSPVSITIKETDGTYSFANTFFLDLAGLELDKVIGFRDSDIFPVEIADRITEKDRQCFQSRHPLNTEEMFFKGTYLINRFLITTGEQGRISLCTIATDISEQKKTEKKLSQAAAVFDSTSDAIFICDKDFSIKSVNNAFIELTGFCQNDISGMSANLLYESIDQNHMIPEVAQALETDGQWSGEIWIARKDGGSPLPCWLSVNRVDDAPDNTIYIGVFSDISVLRETREKIVFIAHHDSLTNLPNRLLFNDRLDHALFKAQRTNSLLAILFIDLDRFKYINDTHGHPVGDQLLIEVAKRLRSCLREEDTIARLGGDEFVVLLESLSDRFDASRIAQSLIALLSDKPMTLESQTLSITASIGISLYPEDGKDVTTLIKNADIAMYDAKDKGRNNFSFYTSSLTEIASERLVLENDLRKALVNNELELYFQPQVDVRLNQIIGIETLLRWMHPQKGMIPPNHFIPVAEESDLIMELGNWVLENALNTANQWYNAGLLPLIPVSINLSARQIFNDDLSQRLIKLLGNIMLPADQVELEVTESAVMKFPERAEKTLKAIKKLGITLALDDFGTGYSSLSYLKRFPIDRLKIDRSFIRDIPDDENDRALTKAIIAMAKNLDISVIAEGVETESQCNYLKQNGCYEIQGFLFYKPMPEQAMKQVLLQELAHEKH